ncbi:hypothetical protein SLS62_004787 [Diatrype stigma]|uniref:Glycosyl transferase family 25 domain-containing protein n=1 Tax=Diatrype stigma TaxID=117547 RepID=A0AAN9USQ3_9PEZI
MSGNPHSTFLGVSDEESGLNSDIYNSTFGFEKIFVVSLPSRTDRRDAITLSAALSGIEVEFIDGLQGQDVPDKAIPSGPDQERMGDASIGSWRGHMNAIQEIVRRNLSSALILEDDVDWDVRIKDQLRDFALSSRALTQPLLRESDHPYADVTYPYPSEGDSYIDLGRSSPDILFTEMPPTQPPRTSPYGDNWALLWLGQCGLTFPREDGKGLIPKGRVVHMDDETVAEKRHLTTWTKPDELKAQYPDHTRVVHHAYQPLCSLGYAVTQRTARQLLHELGLKPFDRAFDLLLASFCDGGAGRGHHDCLSLQPGLFHNHLPAGPRRAESDISDHGNGYDEIAKTPNVRFSVRMNAGALLDGLPLTDQFPDLPAV